MLPVRLPSRRHLARAVILLGLPALLPGGCLQPFTPPEVSGGRGFLVVDGFLNAGDDSTRIRLTRTQLLRDPRQTPAERGAQVRIEGDRGAAYALTEGSPGNYAMPAVLPGDGQQYRLRIRTSNGQEYLSAYVPVKLTPPIDSVNWQVTGDGVQVYVNTHDPAANTRFYRWEFEETWEFRTPFPLQYYLNKGKKELVRENVNRCWKHVPSRQIVLGTSRLLTEDIIYQYPLVRMESTSEKHRTRYSILVRQYALTREAYDYWQNLERNTENLGTLFDPQPSEVLGNIASVNNPEEPVMGFFGAGSVQEKRLFLTRDQLPEWPRITGYEQCFLDSLPNNESVRELLQTTVLPVVFEISMGGSIMYYLTSEPRCIDCRLSGTNKMPPYWE
jgi:hypothetical protein